MQLLRLKLVNFRQHELTELEFGPGLTAIVGPNGAGKSTLLEAIGYALYGVPATRGTRDTLRRRGAPPRARFEVELEFELGMRRYRIVRTLTAAELYLDGQAIANSTAAVSERICALLGMGREEFFHTYFTGQKELAVMAAMTPSERARFLSRVLGYEKLREAQDRLRERRNERRSQLAGLEQGLADPDELNHAVERATETLQRSRAVHQTAAERDQSARTALSVLEPGWVLAQQGRVSWQGLDGERRVVEGRVAAARAAFETLDREMASALDAQRKLAPLTAQLAELVPLLAEREQLDLAAAAVTERSRAVARRDAYRERIVKVEEELAALPDDAAFAALEVSRHAVLTARDAAEQRLAERRTRWNQDDQEVRTRLEQFRNHYKELREQYTTIEDRGPEGICPTCGRPLGKDFRSLLDLLTRQLEEVQIDGQYLRQRAEQLKEPPEDLVALQEEHRLSDMALRRATEQLAAAESQRLRRITLRDEREMLLGEIVKLEAELAGPAASYDSARHEAVRAQLAVLEPIRREYDQLQGLAQRAALLVAESATAEQAATLAETALAEVDRRLKSLGWDPVAYAALETRMREAEVAVQQAHLDLVRAEGELESATKLQAAAIARHADRAAKAETVRRLSGEVERLHELDRAFGELRTELNLQLRPDLAERSARFLHDLTVGRYADLELTEEYVAMVVEDGEVKPVISGGEEDVLNLALRLAISQMIAERAGQPLSLLVLDEIFGSLDEERRQAVLDLLRALVDRFPQVILISHVEGMRDAYDRILRVQYDEERGITTVRDDLPELADVAV